MTVFVSPKIEALDGADIFVEESPENADLPIQLKQCIVTIKRDGKPDVAIRLGFDATYALRVVLDECFRDIPGAVTK